MKTALVLLFVCCLSGSCDAAAQLLWPRQLLLWWPWSTSSPSPAPPSPSPAPPSPSPSPSTKGRRVPTVAKASSTGGTSKALASATSEAFTKVSNNLVEYFEYAFNNLDGEKGEESTEEYCTNALSILEKELEAIGEVTATAYSEAVATVEVSGSGDACASAEATAKSQASGFAKILVDAIAEASSKESAVEAQTAVDVVIDVIAEVFTRAFSKACVKDEGSASVVQSSFSEAIIKPLASVAVMAVAEVDCSEAGGFVLTEAETSTSAEEDVTTETNSTASVKGEGETIGETAAEAETAVFEPCTGKYEICCHIVGDTCTCSENQSKKCDAVRLKYEKGTYWKDEDSEVKCICPESWPQEEFLTII